MKQFFSKKYYVFGSILILLSLILNGCQKMNKIPLVGQNTTTEKCRQLQADYNSDKFDEFYLVDNDVSKNTWKKKSEYDENKNFYKVLSRWIDPKATVVSLKSFSPSGDWIRFDEYCFNQDRIIASLQSVLNTFYGDVSVKRNWDFYTDGTIKTESINITDLNTGELIDVGVANYLDNPPYLALSYQDLFTELDFK